MRTAADTVALPRPSKATLPQLQDASLVIVSGAEAYTAAARLRVELAGNGRRSIEFTEDVRIAADKHAQIMREMARAVGGVAVFIAAFPERTEVISGMADLHVIAPAGVGNRVWIVSPDGESITWPLCAFHPLQCRLLIPGLLSGCVEFASGYDEGRPHLRFKICAAGARLFFRMLDIGASLSRQAKHG